MPNIKAQRPEIIQGELEVLAFNRHDDLEEAIEVLLSGKYVLILDFYSTGLLLLNELKAYLRWEEKQKFQEERSKRKNFRELSHRIILEVAHQSLRVKKAPKIAWLKILYPEQKEFALSFPDIQGLNSSWQWYEKGIQIPTLPHKIHPWYGSYFPTRFEHIELFDEFLGNTNLNREKAFDVGVGSGVLSFQMHQHGFKSIQSSDQNPNAIIGMEEELKRLNISNIELHYGDLFVGNDALQDVIVFNPPWLPAIGNIENLDTAIYYNQELFSKFFEQAFERLKPDGRLVVLFSNLVKLTHPNEIHPIEQEVKTGGRFIKDTLLKKPVEQASKKTKRNLKRREQEIVELWSLKRST